MSDSICIHDDGDTRHIQLDRPALHNAFDELMITDLSAALATAGADNTVRVVVLGATGASFSAGADLHWMRGMIRASEAENRADSLQLAALMRTLQFLPKPTIARVNGAAYGGGVGLIACCDVAIGVDSARFGLTEVKLGLVPAVISPYVIQAIGLRQARRLFISGEIFNAASALQLGLLHQVVPAADLDAAIANHIGLLRQAGPRAQTEAKQLALRMAGSTLESAERIDRENAELIARLRVSAEGQEGLGAFLGKHAPSWLASA